MSRAVIILLGLLALALLTFLCVRNHSTAIQADIQDQVTHHLAAEPTTWAKASTNGRNVILSGLAASEALRDKAEEVARAVPGVVNVDNQIQLAKAEEVIIPKIEEPPLIHSPYKTQFIKTASGITLNGLAPDSDKRTALIKLAENKFGIENVIDQLETGMGAPENWLQTAKSALNNLVLFKDGNANITDSHIILTGQVENNDAKKTIENNLSQLSGNFTVDLNLTTPSVTVTKSNEMSTSQEDSTVSCADQFKQLLANDQVVNFSTDSSNLETQSQRVIKKILQFSSVCPHSIIEVAGHADSRGSENYNLTLSKNRANVFAKKLIKNGFPAKMLKIEGYGESNPSSNNKTKQGQASNRRIEFRYLQEGE